MENVTDPTAQFVEVVIDEHDRLYGPTLRRVRPSELLAPDGPADPESNSGNDPAPSPGPSEPEPAPPRNASRDVWADYAETLGITVPTSAGRDEIITLVEKHQRGGNQ
jgi:hypothetical protein